MKSLLFMKKQTAVLLFVLFSSISIFCSSCTSDENDNYSSSNSFDFFHSKYEGAMNSSSYLDQQLMQNSVEVPSVDETQESSSFQILKMSE